MKRKWLLAVMTLAVLALVMTGCTVAANPETGAGYQGGQNETVAGSGGGNGNGAAANEYSAAGLENGNAQNDEIVAGNQGNGNRANGQDDCEEDCLVTDDGTSASAYVPSDDDTTASLEGYGSTGALADNDLTLADMLTYALQDEYLAHAEYEYIIGAYGSIRPFTNIIRAEETHIETLLPLFETYGIAVPENDADTRVASVASLTEAYQAGVEAEIMNIDMYEAFLAEELPSDVRTVFESLMKASESHLQAFENKL